MRKLIVSNLISVDGYASGPDDDVMALPFDTTFSDYNLELMRAADTLVFGAVTFRGMVGYWPSVADDPAQSDVERAIAQRHRELEHLVVSDSLTMEEAGAWRDNTRIVRRDGLETSSPKPGRVPAAPARVRQHDHVERSAHRRPCR